MALAFRSKSFKPFKLCNIRPAAESTGLTCAGGFTFGAAAPAATVVAPAEAKPEATPAAGGFSFGAPAPRYETRRVVRAVGAVDRSLLAYPRAYCIITAEQKDDVQTDIHWFLRAPSETARTLRFRAERKQLEMLEGFLPEAQGLILALTVLYVPYSLDSSV